MKFLAGERGLVPVVEAECHEVADDAPGTTGQGVQVVPALLNGGPAVETVVVQVGVRAFEFDHGRGFRRRGRREVAERPVGGPDAGDREIALLLVGFRALGGGLVAERFSEHFVQKVGVEGGLLFPEMSLLLHVHPAHQDFFGAVKGLAQEHFVLRALGQVTRQNEGAPPTAAWLAEEVGLRRRRVWARSPFRHVVSLCEPLRESGRT